MLEAAWGDAGAGVAAAIEDAAGSGVARRLWERDASLWSSDPVVAATIANRLGWLDVADRTRERLAELEAFGAGVAGAARVVLLGMGGSSLAPEVLARVFGRGGLTVLDSTDPDEVAAVRPDPGAVYVVASKSGETIETRSHAAHFLDAVGDPSRFVAVTDPGSPLEALARERGFGRVFLNPPDVGGRYSALSMFGLVPAVAAGIGAAPLLDRAREAMDACRAGPANPGAALGAALGELALRGRDKLTFLASPGIEPFGAWAEQLVAESTGKGGRGIVPVDGEPPGPPEVYGADRVFVHLRLAGEPAHDAAAGALVRAGHPVVTLALRDPADLGGQFFLWELATAVAGWRLGINPFDEPNVAESKRNTASLIEAYGRTGSLPASAPAAEERGVALYAAGSPGTVADGLRAFLGGVGAGDYLALQAFLPRVATIEAALRGIRTALRDRLRVATTVGFGPRFLHSTGQLHKGGPASGAFVQITAEHAADVAVPGAGYTFGVLQAAQAAGDLAALREHGRRAIRVHLTEGAGPGLAALTDLVARALPA